MIERLKSFREDQNGAVAVTYALALTGLVAIAGVAFDYSRLMALDSELQSAADEAALAAATQLTGQSGAIDKAKLAVTNYFAKVSSSDMVVNRTLMANDRAGSAITGVTFTFYTSFDSATDTFGAVTTTDATAKVVKVTINGRKAFYAFTPIVGAFNSGSLTADAVAGLQTNTCKLPPLMVCGPTGQADFPTTADVGKGMVLKVGGGGQWFPGNYGYVDFGNGGNTVKDLLASNTVNDSCVGGDSITTQPGNIASATDYLNTRFDVYTNPLTTSDCTNRANGNYCPAKNTRKDLVIREVYTFDKIKNQSSQPAAPARPACGAAAPTNGSKSVSDWMEMPSTSLPTGTVIGFPRDTCHYGSTCAGGNIGDGTWNSSGYYATHPNLPGGLTTRYAIYKWERDNPGSGMQSGIANTGDSVQWTVNGCNGNGSKCDYTPVWTNYCSYPQPIKGTYYSTPKDRRLLTVAVIDCPAGNNYGSGNKSGGKLEAPVNKWMDVFLTEPSWNRSSPAVTSNQEIYGEVASVATTPNGNSAFQFFSRNKAVLLQ